MIVIDRSEIPKPEFWDSPQFQEFLKEWCRFHATEGGTRGTQRRAPFEKELENFRQQAFWPLQQATQGRCAYTEQDLGYEGEDAMVVFHRPLADAMDETSETSPQHYWWTLCDWSNWLPASRQVQVTKGNLFPVAGPRSLAPETDEVPSRSWLDETRDRGLLLEPGRDHPAWHLEFRGDGTVHPRSHPSRRALDRAAGASRGEITIRLLDLNREDLVAQRQDSLHRLRQGLQPLLVSHLSPDGLPVGSLEKFQGSIRQLTASLFLRVLPAVEDSPRAHVFVEERAEDLAALIAYEGVPWDRNPVGPEFWRPVHDVWRREWPELTDAEADRLLRIEGPVSLSAEQKDGFGVRGDAQKAPARARAATGASEVVSATGHLASERVVESSARVESLKIKNFKAIEYLELELRKDGVIIPARYGVAESSQTAVNWTAFLGENGSGKSCLMQAIGLALAGDQLDHIVAQCQLDWRKLLRRGETQGRVFLRFTGGTEIDLRFNANKHWWVGGAPRMAGFLRGYGATRLLESEPEESDKASSSNVRVANLIDPRARVLDAERWLLDLDDEGDFNTAALTLSGFLGAESPLLGEAAPTSRPFLTRDPDADGGKGEVLAGGEPLSYASDGYRAVVALVCDVMAGLGVGLSDMRNASGIVLIDEIGAHLHPRWKMEITSRMRREFPQLQFFVSTHEPLCLRGLREREVFRVRKKLPKEAEPTVFAGRVELEVIERSPSDYRVDQLLTSEFFGLDTTIDPDLDRRFQAYFRLQTMTREDREASQLPWDEGVSLQQEFERLREFLRNKSNPVLGFTRRDQLVFEAIDGFLAEEKTCSPEERNERRRTTLRKIQDIWQPPESLMTVRRRAS